MLDNKSGDLFAHVKDEFSEFNVFFKKPIGYEFFKFNF